MKRYWYAVMQDKECDDWGTGFYDLDKAVELTAKYRLGAVDGESYPDAYIDIVDDGGDPMTVISVDHIHNLFSVVDTDDINGMGDFTLMYYIDCLSYWNAELMDELIKRADIYDESSGILKQWNCNGGEYDVQSFFDEAFEIIKKFHNEK